tara:strand:+ start:1459 stop:1779 length:321 start_codon:yes stop_codon:yes gene_type:complete
MSTVTQCEFCGNHNQWQPFTMIHGKTGGRCELYLDGHKVDGRKDPYGMFRMWTTDSDTCVHGKSITTWYNGDDSDPDWGFDGNCEDCLMWSFTLDSHYHPRTRNYR